MNAKSPSPFGDGELIIVTLQGFEPRTSASVVRCSIQLSYRAVPFLGLQI